MAFSVIQVGQAKYQLQNILLMDVLELAKMPPRHYERQLTQILTTITGDADSVQKLTVHERYAIFLTYLNLTKSNSLSENLNIADFLAEDLTDFENKRVHGNNVSIRHLTGVEAEALEIGCEHTDDWILGAMAITVGTSTLPPIDNTNYSVAYAGKIIAQRIEQMKLLSHDEFNELAAEYYFLQGQMKSLISFSFDEGIVLNQLRNGGADDAPVRFRPNTALSGYAKQFLSIAIEARTAI